MKRERLIRGSLEEAASFDWYRTARELNVPAERARALYDEAMARAAYPGSRSAQDLYLDWLEDEQPVRRLEPGKRTRTMSAAAAAGGWQRLPRLDDAPVDPGRRMRSSALDGREALAERRLPAPVLDKMERAYGQRFDDVEVHADAAEVPAGQQAFTRGRAIYLERGLELDSAHGEHVVAHELAHVAQQSRPASSEQAPAGAQGGPRGPSRAALEADAHQAALSALAGRAAMVQLSAPMHAALGFSNGGAHPAPSGGGGGSPQSAHGGAPAPAGGGSAGSAPRTTAPGGAPRPASSPGAAGQPRPGSAPRPAAPTATHGGPGTDGVLVPQAPNAMTPAAASRLQHVDGQNTQVASATTNLPTADHQTDVARAAVVEPKSEQDARAQHDVVAAVDNRPPPSPEIVAACARIREVIRAKRPPDEDKLVEAKPKEMAQEAGQQMSSGVEQRTGTVRQGYADMQQQPQGQPTRPPTPASLPPARAQTPQVDAAAGAPDPLHPHDVSLDSDVAAQQARIQSAGMNTPAGQLVQDGPIGDARGAAGELGDAARVDPQQVLANQAQAVAHAQTDMRALQAQAERALAEARAGTVAHIATHTNGVKTSEEEQRARAGAQMQAVFTSTQGSVDRLLQPLSANAVARWDAGVAQLSTAFESSLADVKRRIDERHKGDGSVLGDIGAGLTELGDDVFGLPDWVVEAYDRSEAAFADGSTSLLTDISRDVNVIIEDCKKLIEQARKDIEAIVHSLPQELQTWAQGEAARLNGQLDQLGQKVDQAQHGLNQDLIHRANSAVQQVREQVAALREKARGLIGKIADAITAFLDDPAKAIINGLLSLLGIPPPSFWALIGQLGGVIDGIAADPMKFANTLMSGVGAGFQQFFHNLPTHLGQALFQWLFSKLGEAGVQMPTDFSLRSIITLVLQVLGISWAKVKLILARHIGEQNAELLDQAIQLITTLIEKGPQGLFDMLADQLNPSTIIDMIKDAALQYIMEAIVTRVAARILMMLNPAGAILQAIEAIYRVIKWVIDNAARIFTLIESVVNGAAQILAGNISGVANLVEASLVKLMVPVIDFLAGYLGLGGIPNAIKNLIMGLQSRVEGILDRVIGFLVNKAKALWEAIKRRVGGGQHPDAQQPDPNGQHPQAPVVEHFEMHGESHTVTITRTPHGVSIIMASTPGELMGKIGRASQLCTDEIARLTEAKRNKRGPEAQALGDQLIRAREIKRAIGALNGKYQPKLNDQLDQDQSTQLALEIARDLVTLGRRFNIRGFGDEELDLRSMQELGMPGHQHDHFIYATLVDLGTQIAGHTPAPAAEGASEGERLKAAFEAKLASARGLYASACNGGTNPFSFHGHEFFVEPQRMRSGGSSNYVFPASLRGSPDRYSRYGYNSFRWSVDTLRGLAEKLAKNEPIDADSVTMFLAAMVAEPHRNVVTEVTNMLVLGPTTPGTNQAFAANGGPMPMTTGGTITEPRDGTLDDVRHGSAQSSGGVSDQEVATAKSHYKSATGRDLAEYIDEHGETAAVREHIKTVVRGHLH